MRSSCRDYILLMLFRGMPVAAGHGKVCPGFLFHRRRKTTNLIDNEIHVTAETILSYLFVKEYLSVSTSGVCYERVNG